MKRPLIIVFAAVCAIWLALLPLLVGLYLRGAVPEWTAGWPEAEAVQFQPGWFHSALNWSSADGIDLALRARHVPPLRLGLLHVEGTISSPVTPEPARIRSHIGLAGGWNLSTLVDQIQDPGNLALAADDVRLNLARPSGHALTVNLRAERIGQGRFPDAEPLGPIRLLARQHQDDDGARHLGMDLELLSAALGAAALTVSIGPADADALAELIEGLVQWAGSEPDSLTQRLALLGMVGAWQQLAAGGLVLRIERLELGEHTRVSARWVAQGTQPSIEGSGRVDELAGWYAEIAALAGQAPDQAELIVDAWLLTLAQNGWIRLDGEHFEFIGPTATGGVAQSPIR